MTDLNVEPTETVEDTSDADFEAMRLADEGIEDGGEGEGEGAEEVKEEPKQLDETEKLRASLANRSQAARQEKAARRAAEERAEALEARLAALEGKGKEADPLAGLRDDDADPIGDLEILKRAVRGQTQNAEQERLQRAQAEQQQNNIRQLTSWAGDFENDFREDNPDYDEAAQHVAKGRLEELTAIHGAQAANQKLEAELLDLIIQCKQTNRDPAEVVYHLAKTRGFGSNPVAIDNTSSKLETVKRGQAASKSLGSAGKSDSTELSYESINAIKDPKAKDAAFAKLEAQERRREMHG